MSESQTPTYCCGGDDRCDGNGCECHALRAEVERLREPLQRFVSHFDRCGTAGLSRIAVRDLAAQFRAALAAKEAK